MYPGTKVLVTMVPKLNIPHPVNNHQITNARAVRTGLAGSRVGECT
jgi:hypothetical protein